MGRGMRVRRWRLNRLWPRRLHRLWPRRLNRRWSLRLNRRWPHRSSGSTVARQPSAASEPVGRRAQISAGSRRDAAQLVLFARSPRRTPVLLVAILQTQNPPRTIAWARQWRLEDGSGTDQEHVPCGPRQRAHGGCANPQHHERHEALDGWTGEPFSRVHLAGCELAEGGVKHTDGKCAGKARTRLEKVSSRLLPACECDDDTSLVWADGRSDL